MIVSDLLVKWLKNCAISTRRNSMSSSHPANGNGHRSAPSSLDSVVISHQEAQSITLASIYLLGFGSKLTLWRGPNTPLGLLWATYFMDVWSVGVVIQRGSGMLFSALQMQLVYRDTATSIGPLLVNKWPFLIWYASGLQHLDRKSSAGYSRKVDIKL